MLIVIGVLFLLNNLFPGEFSFGRMWPVILIVIGLVKVLEYFRGPLARPNNSSSTYGPNVNSGPSNGPVTGSGSSGTDKKEGM